VKGLIVIAFRVDVQVNFSELGCIIHSKHATQIGIYAANKVFYVHTECA